MAAQQDQYTYVGEAPVRSILGADFGSVHTRVIFIDQVDGQYRLVSRAQTLTTADPPFGDVTIGLIRALGQITSLIGRNFMNGNQVAIGTGSQQTGADQFIATSSGGRPMRVVMVGLMPDISLASGRNALGSVYVELVDTLTIGDLRSEEERVNTLLNNRPDLIFIVGGTDEGATETMLGLIRAVQLAVSLLPSESRPVVVYAGNEALRERVTELLDNQVELMIAANVRPTLQREHLSGAELELAVAYGSYKANSSGYKDIRSLTRLGVLPTANSYTNLVRYLGELPGAGVGTLSVDVGSSSVTLATALQKKPYISIRSDLGLGQSAVSSAEQIGPENILRWLTYRATPADVMDYAHNKTLRPGTIPQSSEDLEMEWAFTREVIRNALANARQAWHDYSSGLLLPPLNPIIGAGAALTQSIDPGMSAMLLLDALQPYGISRLKLDPYGVIATLGVVAYLTPLAVVQVLESGGLLDLGTAISPEGSTRDNDAMEVIIKIPGGRTVNRIVPNNSFRLLELPGGQKAQVTIKLARGLTLNGRRSVTLDMEGGAAGIICDTRRKPLQLPTDLNKRKELFGRWYASARASTGASLRIAAAVEDETPEEMPTP